MTLRRGDPLESPLLDNGASALNYNRLNEWPLQFLRSEYYARSNGHLAGQTMAGLWWSSTAGFATYGYYMESWAGLVGAQYNYYRGYGFALR